MYKYQSDRSSDENIALALYAIANELNALGLKDAHERMGALELLAYEVKTGSERLTDTLDVFINIFAEKNQ